MHKALLVTASFIGWLLLLPLAGCSDDAREWKQGDACAPADCGAMYCVTSRINGVDTAAMCMPTCTAGAECSTGCCLPLIGFEPTWVCAVPEACGL